MRSRRIGPASTSRTIAIRSDHRQEHPEIPHFVPKDLRRTWKTLAGDAGISKECRDRIQNHAKSDVSSRHYDRYEYLAEKRADMAKWASYLDLVLAGEITDIGQRDAVVVREGAGGLGKRSHLGTATGAVMTLTGDPSPVWRFAELQQIGVRFAKSQQTQRGIRIIRISQLRPVHKPLKRGRLLRAGQRSCRCPQASKLVKRSSFLTVSSYS